jgi:hypothetical protein
MQGWLKKGGKSGSQGAMQGAASCPCRIQGKIAPKKQARKRSKQVLIAALIVSLW